MPNPCPNTLTTSRTGPAAAQRPSGNRITAATSPSGSRTCTFPAPRRVSLPATGMKPPWANDAGLLRLQAKLAFQLRDFGNEAVGHPQRSVQGVDPLFGMEHHRSNERRDHAFAHLPNTRHGIGIVADAVHEPQPVHERLDEPAPGLGWFCLEAIQDVVEERFGGFGRDFVEVDHRWSPCPMPGIGSPPKTNAPAPAISGE